MGRTICLLSILIGAITLSGCRGKATGISSSEEPFEVPMDQYATNHFFVDTSYISLYEPYYQNDPPIINPDMQIVEVEVWVNHFTSNPDSTDHLGIAFMNLPPRPVSGYDSSYSSIRLSNPGSVEVGYFRRLGVVSYTLDALGYIGTLSVDSTIGADYAIAIAYRRADGEQFGDFLDDGFTNSSDSAMVLKMVRPRNLIPGSGYAEAWRMLLKNIYLIRNSHISEQGFQLNIFRTSPGSQAVPSIEGQPLLRVLGLDQYNVNGTPAPNGDGKFDFRPGYTINPNTGEVILPYLRPLDGGIRSYFAKRGSTIPDSMLFPELYDTLSDIYLNSIHDRYVIRGEAIFN